MTSPPLHPEGLPHRLSAINPSAGQHPIPEREADIARALRCGAAAWSHFPYLAMRYGERGRQFTNSDSCWLVSLYDLDDALVLANLQWLRSVLASRGLPTIILEDHVRIIDEDVSADERERWHASTGFRTALEHFLTQRGTLLEKPRHEALIAEWQTRFAACPGRRVRDAAALLICARLDTASGIERAWEVTRAWFIDPHIFSTQWIDTVNALSDTLEAPHALA